jgi:hypothetical protein
MPPDRDPFSQLNRVLEAPSTATGAIRKACAAVEDCVSRNRLAGRDGSPQLDGGCTVPLAAPARSKACTLAQRAAWPSPSTVPPSVACDRGGERSAHSDPTPLMAHPARAHRDDLRGF